jgi:hypothetical protein
VIDRSGGPEREIIETMEGERVSIKGASGNRVEGRGFVV